jgi:hypothetical protein
MTFSRDWRGVNRIAADRDSRLTAAPSARAHDPQYEQEHNRSNRGVNDEADDARAEMNPEAMQKSVADEGANDANRRVADETEPVAPYNLACQPSGNEPDDQNDNQPSSDRCMFCLWPFALIRGVVCDIAKNRAENKLGN